jgi:hypothetical protein
MLFQATHYLTNHHQTRVGQIADKESDLRVFIS